MAGKQMTNTSSGKKDIPNIYCTLQEAATPSSARSRAARDILIDNVHKLQHLETVKNIQGLRTDKEKIPFKDLYPNLTVNQKKLFLKKCKEKMSKLMSLAGKIEHDEETTMYSKEFLETNRVFFKTFIPDAELSKLEAKSTAPNNVYANVYNILKTEVNTTNGSFLYANENPFVPTYVLVPRKDSLKNSGFPREDVVSLHRILTSSKFKLRDSDSKKKHSKNAKPKSKKNKRKYNRGKQREPLSTAYACLGITVPQGQRGLTLCHPKAPTDVKQIKKMLGQIHHLVRMWIPFGLVTILKFMKQEVGDKATFTSVNKKGELNVGKNIFASVQTSFNIITPGHTDLDGFLGVILVSHFPEAKDDDDDKTSYLYSMEEPVALFFCLPTLGIRIALRPGDVLLFNPKVPHCISQRTHDYADERVYVTSFYMKIEQLSLHDNSIPYKNFPAIVKQKKRKRNKIEKEHDDDKVVIDSNKHKKKKNRRIIETSHDDEVINSMFEDENEYVIALDNIRVER